jgi:hypothetical protein
MHANERSKERLRNPSKGVQFMNRTKTCRHIASVAPLLSLSCILACSSAGPLDDEPYQESGPPHEIVLEAKWSDTGRFQLLRDESGHLGMAVTGIIGKDDPRAAGKLIQPSFVETYRSLLPNDAVPPRLAALEARRSPVAAPTDRAPVVERDPSDAALPAEQTVCEPPVNCAFIDTVCHDWVLMKCSFHRLGRCSSGGPGSGNQTPGDSIIISSTICPTANDVSFYWNEATVNGSHALTGVTGSGFIANADSWGWHVWWNGYPCARPHLWLPVGAEVGISSHFKVPQPCAQGEISE